LLVVSGKPERKSGNLVEWQKIPGNWTRTVYFSGYSFVIFCDGIIHSCHQRYSRCQQSAKLVAKMTAANMPGANKVVDRQLTEHLP
jgi:hypothetical protein